MKKNGPAEARAKKPPRERIPRRRLGHLSRFAGVLSDREDHSSDM